MKASDIGLLAVAVLAVAAGAMVFPGLMGDLLDAEPCPVGHHSLDDLEAVSPGLDDGMEQVRRRTTECSASEVAVSDAEIAVDYATDAGAKAAVREVLAAAKGLGWTAEYPRGGAVDTAADGSSRFVLTIETDAGELRLTGFAQDVTDARALGMRGEGLDAAEASGRRTWVSLHIRPAVVSPVPTIDVGMLGGIPTAAPGIGR